MTDTEYKLLVLGVWDSLGPTGQGLVLALLRRITEAERAVDRAGRELADVSLFTEGTESLLACHVAATTSRRVANELEYVLDRAFPPATGRFGDATLEVKVRLIREALKKYELGGTNA